MTGSRLRRVVAGVAALALHAALLMWLTWPFAQHVASHFPDTEAACASDPPQVAWTLAYETHRLATAPALMGEANIFHPTPHALYFGETAFGVLPFFAPVYALSGNPALALNLVLLGGILSTAWGLHLLVARWTDSWCAGVVAAWTFLMNRYVLWLWMPVAPNYAVTFFLPAIVALAAVPDTRWRGVAQMVPLVVLQSLTTIYMAAATMAPLVILSLVRCARRTTRRAGVMMMVAVTISALGVAASEVGHFRVMRENPSLASQTPWLGGPAPPAALPFEPFKPTSATGVPLVSCLLIATGAILRRWSRSETSRLAWTHGGFWALCGILIALPPTVRLAGATMRLPQAFLYEWVPGAQVLRDPVRLGIVGLVGLAILAGAAFNECVRRSGVVRVIALVLIGALMYRQYAGVLPAWAGPRRHALPAAYPLFPAIGVESAILRRLRLPGPPLLELPVGSVGFASAEFHARALYRSIFHWRPLLNGYRSYYPASFPERMRLARQLPDAEALAALRAETGVGTVLVHLGEIPSPAKRAAWLALAAEAHPTSRLQLVLREGNDLLFEVADVEPDRSPDEAPVVGRPGS